MGLLDSSGRGSGLPGSLGGQLLTGSFSSGGFTGGLLCTGHGGFQLSLVEVNQAILAWSF